MFKQSAFEAYKFLLERNQDGGHTAAMIAKFISVGYEVKFIDSLYLNGEDYVPGVSVILRGDQEDREFDSSPNIEKALAMAYYQIYGELMDEDTAYHRLHGDSDCFDNELDEDIAPENVVIQADEILDDMPEGAIVRIKKVGDAFQAIHCPDDSTVFPGESRYSFAYALKYALERPTRSDDLPTDSSIAQALAGFPHDVALHLERHGGYGWHVGYIDKRDEVVSVYNPTPVTDMPLLDGIKQAGLALQFDRLGECLLCDSTLFIYNKGEDTQSITCKGCKTTFTFPSNLTPVEIVKKWNAKKG